MTVITNILYWISSGMLIPVIIALLAAFGWSLMLVGDLYAQFARRTRNHTRIGTLLERVHNEPVRAVVGDHLRGDGPYLTSYLRRFIDTDWHPVHGEKVLTDFELDMKKSLEAPLLLMRVGPMLGLMGTLIPMGPALVGLAAGDIQSMALNMRVAFSTTVVGLFVGAAGFQVHLLRQRWHRADGETLQYLFELSRTEAAT